MTRCVHAKINGDNQVDSANKVAYLGPAFSFSHQAAEAVHTTGRHTPLPSFTAIFEALQHDPTYDCAVLPIENSTNGNVVQALDLLAKCGPDADTSLYPDLEAVGEYYLDVHHCLYVNKQWLRSCSRLDRPTDIGAVACTDNSAPLKLNDLSSMMLHNLRIGSVHSHPQVWGQCNIFLSQVLPSAQVERIDMSSTSAAAKLVSSSFPVPQDLSTNHKPCAAIASKLAGDNDQNLTLVSENIEDDPGANTTRFLILRNARHEKPSSSVFIEKQTQPDLQHKFILNFTTAHDQPGSLAQALAVFSSLGFNLCAIQSRPRPWPRNSGSGGTPKTIDRNWHYVFFVECLGKAIPENVEELMSRLEKLCESVKLLGFWVDRSSSR